MPIQKTQLLELEAQLIQNTQKVTDAINQLKLQIRAMQQELLPNSSPYAKATQKFWVIVQETIKDEKEIAFEEHSNLKVDGLDEDDLNLYDELDALRFKRLLFGIDAPSLANLERRRQFIAGSIPLGF